MLESAKTEDGGTVTRGASQAALIDRERDVLARIVAGLPLKDVLTDLLLAVDAQGGGGMRTSILLAGDGGKTLHHGAAPNLPAAYNAAIDGIAVGEGVGSCGTAMSRGQPVIVGDIATDPLWADFKELALRHGLRACWSTPVRAADGRSLGTFAIYYGEPRLPTPDDLDLIAVVSQTTALAIERCQSDSELRAQRDELARVNALLTEEVSARTQERDRIWNSTNDLMGVASLAGRLLQVNPAWTRQLGYPENELIGRPFAELVDEADHSKMANVVAQLGASVPVRDFVDRVICKDGERKTILWDAMPDGEAFYIVGRDIGELQRLQEQLRQAQKMEAVGQLTGGIAHDFNNLLAGITGSLELLSTRIAQGRLDAVPRYLDAAQGAARRAATLTQRLLAFSRRQTLDPRPTDVNRLIASMEELFRRSIGPIVSMEVVGAGGLWPTLIDPGQLENALLNLCINARDAMPDGGRITIETANKWLDDRAANERELPPGQYVSLSVTDTGTGMSTDVAARAFEPFFTTKPLGQGTGLGLSMIYGFVRQSGGQLRIYSEEGQGTTMCLYLPRFVGEAETDTGPASLHAYDAGHGEAVLVVDDEPTVRMLVVDVLQEAGYRVLEAEDGPQGLKILQSAARIDLLITDVGLPGGMNGRQVADAGRTVRPNLKVLFVTGYAENSVVGNGHLDPGMQVMTKPFAIEMLGNKVREIIDG